MSQTANGFPSGMRSRRHEGRCPVSSRARREHRLYIGSGFSPSAEWVSLNVVFQVPAVLGSMAA